MPSRSWEAGETHKDSAALAFTSSAQVPVKVEKKKQNCRNDADVVTLQDGKVYEGAYS